MDSLSLEQRYFIEAEKRKRPEGTAQFVDLKESDNDRLRHLVDDIWADHAALDALPSPLKGGDRIEFLIVGAGMGGIVTAVRLIEAGFSAEQIRIVESGGGVGGTWYWNRYPGLHCDFESYVYLPLLEETGYVPPNKYVSAAEIREYLVEVARKWNLAEKIAFRTTLDGLKWDEDARCWEVDVTSGRGKDGQIKESFTVDADFVFINSGHFPRPHVPKLRGLESFGGDMMHTSRWDYTITGGSSDTPFPEMNKLRGKRIGIVGTGATAVQVVPELTKYAEELYVFQRTPSAVYERGQRPTDETEWRRKIAANPGWQKERMENFSLHLAYSPLLLPDSEDLVNDEWTKLKAYCVVTGSDAFDTITPTEVPQHIARMMALDAESRAQVRARTVEVVKDKETAERLTPWYPTWCKRPTFSDVYLQAFNQPHVHLVDTDGKGVDSVTTKGVVANGKEYPVDVIILSTGYRSPTYGDGDPAKRMGIEIVGRGGRTSSEKWSAQGATTLHGFATGGFPNLFWIPVVQGGFDNAGHVIDACSRHIAYIIAEGHKRTGWEKVHGTVIDVMSAAEEAWSTLIMAGATHFAGPFSVCTPSYWTNEGEATQVPGSREEMMKKARVAAYSKGMVPYVRLLEAWRNEGSLSGIEISAA